MFPYIPIISLKSYLSTPILKFFWKNFVCLDN